MEALLTLILLFFSMLRFLRSYLSIDPLADWALFFLALIPAILSSRPLLLSEQILKKKCGKWSYSRFGTVISVSRWLLTFSLSSLCCILVFGIVSSTRLIWLPFLGLSLAVAMLYGFLFSSFLDCAGESVLVFNKFLKEFSKEPNDTDFTQLMRLTRKIVANAKFYNMKISPNKLALGLTLSLIDDRETTLNDIQDLITWAEESAEKGNLAKFRSLVEKYLLVAVQSKKGGIAEMVPWNFDKATRTLEVLAMPIVITALAVLLPKMLGVSG